MSENTTLGDAIRLRRLQLGISQEELAERIGDDVRQSDVSRLERGKILFPRLERLNQIAASLDLTLGELLAEAGWFSGEMPLDRFKPVEKRGAGASILIADDEPVSLDAIADLLADYGYLTNMAYDLSTLRSVIEADRPDIVIADIALPGLDADALAPQLSAERPAIHLVYMGLGLPSGSIEVPYLEKPIDSRQLVALVDSIEIGRSKNEGLLEENP